MTSLIVSTRQQLAMIGSDYAYREGRACVDCGRALPDKALWDYEVCYLDFMLRRKPYPHTATPGYVPWRYEPTRRVAEWLQQQSGYERLDVKFECEMFRNFYQDAKYRTVDVDGAFINWLKVFFGGKA